MPRAKNIYQFCGYIILVKNPGAKGICEVVVQVGYRVGYAAYLGFQGQVGGKSITEEVAPGFGVMLDSLAYFPRQIQALAIVFKLIHDSEALVVMAETIWVKSAKLILTYMAEGRVPHVVAHGDRLGEVFIQVESPGYSSSNLRDLEGVVKPGHVVVSLRRDEDLRLVL